MKFSVETIRGLVRPIITGALVGGFVIAAFVNDAAADRLEDAFLIVLTFWFVERAINKARS